MLLAHATCPKCGYERTGNQHMRHVQQASILVLCHPIQLQLQESGKHGLVDFENRTEGIQPHVYVLQELPAGQEKG